MQFHERSARKVLLEKKRKGPDSGVCSERRGEAQVAWTRGALPRDPRVQRDRDDVLCSRIAEKGRAYDQLPVAEAACEVGGVPAELAGACSAGRSSLRVGVSC